LALWLCAACSSEVAAGLDEAQSQEALATLASAGIAADRQSSGEGGTYRIEVATADAGQAAAVLRAYGLPRKPKKGFAELYQNASMIPTPTEDKARFLDALSGEIAAHLERLDGVVEASVIVTAPDDDPLAPADKVRAEPTASVLLKVRADAKLPGDDEVRKLVAGAVEGMKPPGVAIVRVTAPAVAAKGTLMDRVGPIRVASSSKTWLLSLLIGALAAVILMALWVIRTGTRAGRQGGTR